MPPPTPQETAAALLRAAEARRVREAAARAALAAPVVPPAPGLTTGGAATAADDAAKAAERARRLRTLRNGSLWTVGIGGAVVGGAYLHHLWRNRQTERARLGINDVLDAELRRDGSLVGQVEAIIHAATGDTALRFGDPRDRSQEVLHTLRPDQYRHLPPVLQPARTGDDIPGPRPDVDDGHATSRRFRYVTIPGANGARLVVGVGLSADRVRGQQFLTEGMRDVPVGAQVTFEMRGNDPALHRVMADIIQRQFAANAAAITTPGATPFSRQAFLAACQAGQPGQFQTFTAGGRTINCTTALDADGRTRLLRVSIEGLSAPLPPR